MRAKTLTVIVRDMTHKQMGMIHRYDKKEIDTTEIRSTENTRKTNEDENKEVVLFRFQKVNR